jgi:hypothetical protein
LFLAHLLGHAEELWGSVEYANLEHVVFSVENKDTEQDTEVYKDPYLGWEEPYYNTPDYKIGMEKLKTLPKVQFKCSLKWLTNVKDKKWCTYKAFDAKPRPGESIEMGDMQITPSLRQIWEALFHGNG